MARGRGGLRRIFAALLCALAALPEVAAWAESGESLIESAELQQMIEDYIADNGLNGNNLSVGYCYTATGDEWYYNEDKWYYSASMYKVPLMMILAEREYEGELSQESDIKGLSLAYAEESILVYSNNDFAHLVMSYIGTDRECRELYQKYSELSLEDYDPDFYAYSYFNTSFMMDVMETLYFRQERFPNIIENLKKAQTENYFHQELGDRYEIAQKYGSYKEFNSTAGIIYTPNPFILTVMTKNMGVGGGEKIISDMAVYFADYTLRLDEKLSAVEEQAQPETETPAPVESEPEPASEQSAEPEPEESDACVPTAEPETKAPDRRNLIIGGGAVLVVVVAAALLLPVRKRAVSGRKSRYTPKH